MADKEFIPGLSAKAPNDRAPDFVKAKVSIKVAELLPFLQAELAKGTDWINGDLKVSQGGKYYIERDNWKPEGKRDAPKPSGHGKTQAPADDFIEDDLAF